MNLLSPRSILLACALTPTASAQLFEIHSDDGLIDPQGVNATHSASFPELPGVNLAGTDLIPGDFDLDGDMDLWVVSDSSDRLYVNESTAYANAQGRWFDLAVTRPNNGGTSGASGDLDGDGDPDVLVGVSLPLPGGGTSGDVIFMRNLTFDVNEVPFGFVDASGTAMLSDPVPPMGGVNDVVLGDWDGDGTLDILAATDTGVEAFLGVAAAPGTFARFPGGLPAPVGAGVPQALAIGNVDGDPALELVVGTDAANYLIDNVAGPALFAVVPGAIPPVAQDTRALALLNIAAAPGLHLYVGNTPGAGAVPSGSDLLHTNVAGVFGVGIAQTGPAQSTLSIATVDFDLDGDQDIAVAGDTDPMLPSEGQPVLLENDGDFTTVPVTAALVEPVPLGLPIAPRTNAAIAAADMDMDDDIDLITSTLSESSVRYYANLYRHIDAPQIYTAGSTNPLVIRCFDRNGINPATDVASAWLGYQFEAPGPRTFPLGATVGASALDGNVTTLQQFFAFLPNITFDFANLPPSLAGSTVYFQGLWLNVPGTPPPTINHFTNVIQVTLQ